MLFKVMVIFFTKKRICLGQMDNFRRNLISGIRNLVYKLPHELLNDLSLGSLEISKFYKKSK